MNGNLTRKVCTKCKVVKELTEFRQNRTTKDGRTFWCKKCHNLPKEPPEGVTTKTCTKCKQVKELTEYYRNPSGKYGRDSHCKSCQKISKEPPPEGVTTKVCKACKKEKELTEYRKSIRGLYGRDGKCKECLVLNKEPPEGVTTRTCSKCKNVKGLAEFGVNLSGKYGKRSECNQCRSKEGIYERQQGIKVTCSICKQVLDQSCFGLRYKSENGLQESCKRCRYDSKFENEEEKIQYFLEELYKRSKRGAVKRKLSFDIELEDIRQMLKEQNGKCKLTGQQLTFELSNEMNMSIDRIDSSKGYTIDNIQLVGVAVNIMKWDQPVDQFLHMCHLVVEHNQKNGKN